jgi:UDP-N-acetylmuramate: L-alanyl-gamma-D-glutamyl-meso-diaminopimelate ligase
MKRLPGLDEDLIAKAFGNENLTIFADSNQMISWLKQLSPGKRVFLMMSSGNFDGIDLNVLADELL